MVSPPLVITNSVKSSKPQIVIFYFDYFFHWVPSFTRVLQKVSIFFKLF
ncbi:unnamed protein product, partial [Staurois parvus]